MSQSLVRGVLGDSSFSAYTWAGGVWNSMLTTISSLAYVVNARLEAVVTVLQLFPK